MFDRLKSLYSQHRLTVTQINAAVTRGWITQDQADEILLSD